MQGGDCLCRTEALCLKALAVAAAACMSVQPAAADIQVSFQVERLEGASAMSACFCPARLPGLGRSLEWMSGAAALSASWSCRPSESLAVHFCAADSDGIASGRQRATNRGSGGAQRQGLAAARRRLCAALWQHHCGGEQRELLSSHSQGQQGDAEEPRDQRGVPCAHRLSRCFCSSILRTVPL